MMIHSEWIQNCYGCGGLAQWVERPHTYTEAVSPLQLVAGSNPVSDPLLRVIPPSLCPLSCLLFSCPIN